MRTGDYLIQKWRMKVASKWIPSDSRLLDIGCHQGELFQMLQDHIENSIGIDPLLKPRLHQELINYCALNSRSLCRFLIKVLMLSLFWQSLNTCVKNQPLQENANDYYAQADELLLQSHLKWWTKYWTY